MLSKKMTKAKLRKVSYMTEIGKIIEREKTQFSHTKTLLIIFYVK